MKTQNAPPRSLPLELGESQSFRGLTTVPLFPLETPSLEYIGLGEAVARGLTVHEVDVHGDVQTLFLDNPLSERVLLYEGEELVGAKQNRIPERTLLVEAACTLKIPVCVERGFEEYLEALPRQDS